MPIEIVQVDSFTDRPFAGNPAAVCMLDRARDEEWMQQVAGEMNLSETAFLVRRPGRATNAWNLRWFTPTREVDLCGHATLASAHVLWEEHGADQDSELTFGTRSGLLTATRRGQWIEMNFPAQPSELCEPPPGLLSALGVTPIFVGRSHVNYIIEVSDESTLQAIRPDFAALARLDAQGVIVTSLPGTPGVDFVSRYFAPAVGVDEDPVTGSAHCCLGPFWHERLGKGSFIAKQVSARGGIVKVALAGNRVLLAGRAVTVLRAHLSEEASAPATPSAGPSATPSAGPGPNTAAP